MANIKETISCLEDKLGCTAKIEGPGSCAMVTCGGGEIYVCQNSASHDELDEPDDARWSEEPCCCC
jgi:hypothetical protein